MGGLPSATNNESNLQRTSRDIHKEFSNEAIFYEMEVEGSLYCKQVLFIRFIKVFVGITF